MRSAYWILKKNELHVYCTLNTLKVIFVGIFFFNIETDNYASFWFYDFCCILDFIIKPKFLKSIYGAIFGEKILFSPHVFFLCLIFSISGPTYSHL